MEDWITTTEATRLSRYRMDYLRKLIREGEIEARKWGREWQVSRASLLAYVRQMEQRGKRPGPKPKREKGA